MISQDVSIFFLIQVQDGYLPKIPEELKGSEVNGQLLTTPA
jgi:hypothetical protein